MNVLNGAAENASGAVLWGLADHEGTIRDIVDSTRAVVDHRTYDSFGKVTAETAPATDFVFGYTGSLFEKDIGMNRLGARLYDASVGRWLTEDPSGFSAGDANLYRYVGNNPYNNTDPTGLCGQNLWNGISSVASNLWNGASSIVSNTWNSIRPTVAQTAVNAYEWGAGVANTISSTFASPSPKSTLSEAPLWNPPALTDEEMGWNAAANQPTGWLGTTASVVGNGLYGFGVTGPKNIVVGTAKGVKEVGLEAYDFGAGVVETGGNLAGANWRFDTQSNLGVASTQSNFSYGTHVAETGANVVTLGTYGQGKSLYQLGTGQITVDQASQQIGGTAVFQGVGAKLMSMGQVQANTPVAATMDTIPVGQRMTTYYPPNQGFVGTPITQTLAAGVRIDRIGFEGGTFASPEGTPVPMRSLSPAAQGGPYNVYEVVKPFDVQSGTTAPWFGQPGTGTQYQLPTNVRQLIQSGQLKRVGQ
jgi:RHS repeat-associated protein